MCITYIISKGEKFTNKDKKRSEQLYFINLNSCDKLSKLKGLDVAELLSQIEKHPIEFRDTLNLSSKLTFGTEIEFEKAEYYNILNTLKQIPDLNAESSSIVYTIGNSLTDVKDEEQRVNSSDKPTNKKNIKFVTNSHTYSIKSISEEGLKKLKYAVDYKQKYDKKINFDKNKSIKKVNYINASNAANVVNLGSRADNNYDKWYLKGDITVNSMVNGVVYGGEITSPVLTDNKKTWVDLKRICNMLKENGAIAGDKTGSHIHIGSQMFNENSKALINLMKLWTIYEDIIYRFSYGDELVPRSVMQKYAAPIGGELYEKLNNPTLTQNTKFYKIVDVLKGDRYHSINFNNMKEDKNSIKNTIEVRTPNGTIEPIIWQNNINFFMKLFVYANSNKFDDDVINRKFKKYSQEGAKLDLYGKVYLNDALELSDMIFDNNLDKICFLKQYLKSFKVPNNEQRDKVISKNSSSSIISARI